MKCVLSRFCLLRKSTELSISSKNSLQLTDFKDNKSQNVNHPYLPKDWGWVFLKLYKALYMVCWCRRRMKIDCLRSSSLCYSRLSTVVVRKAGSLDWRTTRCAQHCFMNKNVVLHSRAFFRSKQFIACIIGRWRVN